VTLTIDGSLLTGNYMNSGSNGVNPSVLTMMEYDGYVTLTPRVLTAGNAIHLPWHVLPRQAASETVGELEFDYTPGFGVADVDLTNNGVGDAQNDAYTLIATSPDIPSGAAGAGAPTPDIAAVGVNTFPVPAGFCSGDPSFLWAFAVTSHERQTHLLPVSYQLFLDTDLDGTDDYMITTASNSGPWGVSDARQLVWTIDLATGGADAWFYAEHATNTANTAMYICAEQVGLSGADMLATNVGLDVYAADIYYGGPGDLVSGLVITPYGEGYVGVPEDVAGLGTGTLGAYDFGLFPGNTPELGLLLFTNGDRGSGYRGGATRLTESILIYPTPPPA